jgi:hypothetical protein
MQFEGVVIGLVWHDAEQPEALFVDGNHMTVLEQQVAAGLEPTFRTAMRIAWDPDDVAFSVAPRVAAAITVAATYAASRSQYTSTLAEIEQAALAALRLQK